MHNYTKDELRLFSKKQLIDLYLKLQERANWNREKLNNFGMALAAMGTIE